MEEKLTSEEITKEELEELNIEELADLKIKLEQLALQCEEFIQKNDVN